MNRIIKTKCVSDLAEEINRLKKKSDSLFDKLIALTDIRKQVQLEINLLQTALNEICNTDESV